MRMIVEIPNSQLDSLALLCRRERISRADAIRWEVDKLLDEQKPMGNAMAGAFGIWNDKAGQVRTLREQLRGEWR